MLVPMCEDCFKKFSCIACLDCYKESSEFRPKRPIPPIQGDLPIREYFKLFEVFTIGSGISKDNPGLKTMFINGLSDESKKEIREIPFGAVRPIEYIVAYLANVEDYKHIIFGEKNVNIIEQ
jgi:hypothetical protein